MISTSTLGPTPIAMLNAFEIAALVYDDGVSVDHLMSYFAEELQEHGRRIGGVVQLPPEDENARSRTLRIYDLMTGDVIPIKQHLGEGSGACCLDTQALAEGAVRIRNAVEAGVDLVFISKFSRQEVAGKGFRDEFAVAVAAGIPILTSVKRPMVDEWLKFTGGIGTLMACRLRTLRDWWRETDTRRKAIMAANAERQRLIDELSIERHRQDYSNVVRLFAELP